MPRRSISIPPLLLFLACQQGTHPDYCGAMKTNRTHEHLTEREHCISSGTARMSCFANLSANRCTHKHQSPSVYLDYLLYTDCCCINCCNPISLQGIKLCPCFPKSLSDTVYPVALTPITQYCCCPGFTLWTPMGGFALQLGYILSMLAGKAGGSLPRRHECQMELCYRLLLEKALSSDWCVSNCIKGMLLCVFFSHSQFITMWEALWFSLHQNWWPCSLQMAQRLACMLKSMCKKDTYGPLHKMFVCVQTGRRFSRGFTMLTGELHTCTHMKYM